MLGWCTASWVSSSRDNFWMENGRSLLNREPFPWSLASITGLDLTLSDILLVRDRGCGIMAYHLVVR